MTLFSIITVTRGNLTGLKRTCASVQGQSLQGFEWLVIDGASADGTVEFLKETGADFISEPDSGIYDAMNKGIGRAQGYYLLFLNAGDALAHENALAEIARYIEELQETPDFMYGDALEERTGQEPAYKPARPYTKTVYGMFTHHQAMLYRRDLVNGLRYDTNYKIAADYKFTLEFLKRCETVVYCPFPLCLFESGGISQQKTAQGRREQMRIRKELGICSLPQRLLIYGLQTLLMAVRRIMPGLYWRCKSGRAE